MTKPPFFGCSLSGAARSGRGFTLIELLVVLVISGVLVALAVPSLREMLSNHKSISLLNTFFNAVHLARYEAIMRNARTVLCKSPDGSACATAGGWEQGWIIFHDVNNNGEFDPEETLVHHQAALHTDLRLTGNQPVANYVSYGASGSARLISGAFQAGTFTLCPMSSSSVAVRQIVLSNTGRPRTQKGATADCPHE